MAGWSSRRYDGGQDEDWSDGTAKGNRGWMIVTWQGGRRGRMMCDEVEDRTKKGRKGQGKARQGKGIGLGGARYGRAGQDRTG